MPRHMIMFGLVIPNVSRDDLVRLVVGMQWQVAMVQHMTLWRWSDGLSERVERVGIFSPHTYESADLRPASTIVDEWLGVR